MTCVDSPTTTCISVPSDGLRGVSIHYNGRGTQTLDFAITGVVVAGIILLALVIAIAARKARR